MRQHWYEIWSDESLATPYFLLVMPDEQMLGGVIVLDPRREEGEKACGRVTSRLRLERNDRKNDPTRRCGWRPVRPATLRMPRCGG